MNPPRSISRVSLGAALVIVGLVCTGGEPVQRLFAQAPATPATSSARFWPQWRGPLANGVSTTATPPLSWSEQTNIKWKVEVPGRGTGSPVVWENQIFLLTAVPAGVPLAGSHDPRGGIAPRSAHQFKVLSIDRQTGRTLWERVVREEVPHEATQQENGTWASASAVTDGEHVIASFESRGLYAFDMKGTPVWQKDLGDKQMRNEFGEGATPVLHGHRLVVVWDHQGQSFAATFDKRTGQELWRVNRQEIDTWATPLVVERDGRPQVITAGMNKIRSYDLESGALLWEGPGTTMNPIPSPVHHDGMVFLMSGFRGNNLKAISLAGAKGDISASGHIVWSVDRDTPYVPSPLLYDGVLYFLKTNNGLLSAFDAKTGKPHYQVQRLEQAPNVFSSPVGAAGRVYIAGRDGTTVVLEHGTAFKLLAANTLDDGFDASPALVDRELILRGYRYLYNIQERP